MAKRVGIFGGTFDPVHVGHLVAAVNARHAAGLDEVHLVVANQPWQKSTVLTPADVRYEAVAAAVNGHEGLIASRVELDRGGPTYTADTLAVMGAPGIDLFLILGNDAAAGLSTWDRWEEVAASAEIIVVNRPGAPAPNLPPPWRTRSVEIPALDVSSTDLRARLIDGRPLDFLIPDAAVAVWRKYLQADGFR
jgi:nicotinate-nucleotide adenylyltransferase